MVDWEGGTLPVRAVTGSLHGRAREPPRRVTGIDSGKRPLPPERHPGRVPAYSGSTYCRPCLYQTLWVKPKARA